jgi:hypothetical protein
MNRKVLLMARPRKPWFRDGRNAWYVEIGGKQHRLADGPKANDEESRQQAELEYQRLMPKSWPTPLWTGEIPQLPLSSTVSAYQNQGAARRRARRWCRAAARSRRSSAR